MAVSSGVGKYNGRITPFVVLSCMVAATGGIIFGYDIGISGGVTSMEPFLRKFFPEVFAKMIHDTKISNYCKFDSQLLTSFTSSLYIAGLIATFFASPVTKAYGRKPSILIGGVAFLAGAAFGGAAYNIYMLIIGRVLLGVGVGFANQCQRPKGVPPGTPLISLLPSFDDPIELQVLLLIEERRRRDLHTLSSLGILLIMLPHLLNIYFD